MIASPRVLLFHDGALGDVLLSLPCIIVVKQDSSFLHIAARDDVGRLLRAVGIADEVSSAGSSRYASLFTGQADEQAAEFLSRFNQAVVFTIYRESGFLRSMERLLPVGVIITLPPAGGNIHVSEFRSGQCRGAEAAPISPLLCVPSCYQEPAMDMLSRNGYMRGKRFIAIHPGSGGAAKCWPLERYLAVAERSAALFDAVVLWFTGPVESDELKERIEGFARSTGGIHAVDLELVAVAALLSQCDLYLGNDSGMSHLAAAAGCPVIALFGPTDPDLWRPVGPKTRVIRSASLAEIEVDNVLAEIRRIV